MTTKPVQPQWTLFQALNISDGESLYVETVFGFQELSSWLDHRDGVMHKGLYHLEYDLAPLFLLGKYPIDELRDIVEKDRARKALDKVAE